MANKKFQEYPSLDLPEVAKNILSFWEAQDIFEKSISTRAKKEPFIFYEGPPSANGLPGIHHVMARTIKDIFCRYKTQKGYKVERKAGWDTHGLPIELGVEKELGITKADIGKKISVADYNAACKKAVMRYTDVWNDLTHKMGYWVNTNDPYITYKPKYMESVWWLLKQIYNKGLMYKGYTIQPYSPKAGTGLSSAELNMPGTYNDITDTTITAQFKVLEKDKNPKLKQVPGVVFLLAWTTTPWTLPSNTALTVGPKIEYAVVSTFNQYTHLPINVILAKALIEKQFAKKYTETKNAGELKNYKKGDKTIPFCILDTLTGKELTGLRYEQLLPYALPYQNSENAFRVISGNFVTTEDGTGIVHTAPTFGADDAMVAKEAVPEIPPMLVLDENENPVPLVDLQGRFRPEMGELAGKYVKNEYYNEGEVPERSVDVEIAIKLKEENRAFKVEKYVHSYPNCWRTNKPILYYPLDSWFVKVTAIKKRLHQLNKTINWKPRATGEGRFGNWLADAKDWNLSRSRFWGVPLPIWRTEDGSEEIIIGSMAELKEEMTKAVAAGFMKTDIFSDFAVGDMSEANYEKIDLHKNIVDQIVLCSPQGKPMKRESDLIDVWFDSGSMPYAQWHYPFESKYSNKQTAQPEEAVTVAELEKEIPYPANYIAEGVDQTRGWFYTLHVIAGAVFDSVAFNNVVSNGLVLDKNGQKMSKSVGNTVNPFETIEKYGPDATRWYLISNANPWDNLKFDIKGIEEVQRKFFGTLYNTYSFFSLYANIDGFLGAEDDFKPENRPEIDRWILSELHTLIKKTDAAYHNYEPTQAARAISYFVQEHLSNWYVRLSRRRFWKGDYQDDKISAYQTLYYCLLTVSKLMAPLAPFYADCLYKDLNGTTGKEEAESVHLSNFPVYNSGYVNPQLERRMEKAQIISSLALSLRKKERVKVRQPLRRVVIPVLNAKEKEDIEKVAHLIQSEVNVKTVDLIDDTSGMLVKKIKPNFKTLGPRFGKEMKEIAQAIGRLDQQEIAKIEQNGSITLQVQGKSIKLGIDDLEISSQDIEGWVVTNGQGLTVALDVTLDETLKQEGIARELVNRIQNARKAAGFAVTDKIAVRLLKNSTMQQAVQSNLHYIKTETLATELSFADTIEQGTELQFDGINTKILIQKN